MRKIEKYIEVPNSLNHKTVQRKRSELIKAGCYIDEDLYNKYYKKEDVKQALKSLYHQKCAFCESKVEQLQVEHFRPKSVYYWLAYSWDNLLLACPNCNVYKSQTFEIEGTSAIYDANCLNDIHSLSIVYDKQENPKLVNPEKEDILHLLEIDEFGNLFSEDARVQYTIEIFRLNRPFLTDERKEIFDNFERKLAECCKEYGDDKAILLKRIKELIGDYKEQSTNITSTYYCFRRKLFDTKLKDILKSVLS